MNVVEVMSLAAQLEVILDVDGEREKVIATPSSRLTEELRKGVADNRDELMRNLLIKKAVDFLSGELSGGGWEVAISDDLADAYNDASFADFRKDLRMWSHRALQGQVFKTEEEVRRAFAAERDARTKEVA